MPIRLQLDTSTGRDRLWIRGHRRRGLFFVRSEEGGIGWRSARPVRHWRFWGRTRERDMAAAEDVVEALGLAWTDPTAWDKAVAIATAHRQVAS